MGLITRPPAVFAVPAYCYTKTKRKRKIEAQGGGGNLKLAVLPTAAVYDVVTLRSYFMASLMDAYIRMCLVQEDHQCNSQPF